MADNALRFVVKAVAIGQEVKVTLTWRREPDLIEAISQLVDQQVLLIPDENAEPVLKPAAAR